jgi:hypothetical protein
MVTIRPTLPTGLFGQHTGTIWRAQLPERFKATLQAIMLTARSRDFTPTTVVSTYTARYLAQVLDISTYSMNRRLRELEAAGFISRTTERQEGVSGAQVTIIINMDQIAALPRVDADW